MRTRKTWLSRLFVEALFWVVGRIVQPIPILGFAVNCLQLAI
jgi:hypothetical protein